MIPRMKKWRRTSKLEKVFLCFIGIVVSVNLTTTIVLVPHQGEDTNNRERETNIAKKNEAESKISNPEVIFLSATDAVTLSAKEARQQRTSQYSIDVLIIGSKKSIDQVRVQRETWGSHTAVRHFVLSTEDDDVDPYCQELFTGKRKEEWNDAVNHTRYCREGSFWDDIRTRPELKEHYQSKHYNLMNLRNYPSPTGWICAQRRFMTSLTSFFELYADKESKNSLPDYFILADDDTYVNIDHIIEHFIIEPARRRDAGENIETLAVPPFENPVVTAGCRLDYEIARTTWPYGGFGMFFSRGSLETMIQPIQCSTRSTKTFNFIWPSSNKQPFNEIRTCEKLVNKTKYNYPMNQTIGEELFFEIGDSLNRVMHKYTRGVKNFCLHSDWVIGYLANFHNISRHTPSGRLYDFDDRFAGMEDNRLHAYPRWTRTFHEVASVTGCPRGFMDGSKLGKGKYCLSTDSSCHRMDTSTLRNVHSMAKRKFIHDDHHARL